MTIGIDVRVLARGTRTGVEEYTINLLLHLFSLAPDIKFKLFNATWKKPKIDRRLLNFDNVVLKDLRLPNRALFATACYLNEPKIDKVLGQINTYFNPHFFPAPVSKGVKKVVTFHDLSFCHYPEFFSLKKRLWQRFLMNAEKEAKTADLIIADSASTKADLINVYGLKEQQIRVVYPGLELANSQKKDKSEIKRKYGLPDDFVLYFGTIEPRKNLIGLIKAFDLVKEEINQPQLKLVLAGARGWLCKKIFEEAKKAKYRNNLVFTGFVKEQDKPLLYSLARLFVYPSFFEGFGFPPLEAMAAGIPTIVSYASSLPEVVGEAAIMIDPYNIDELAWAMKEVLLDERLQKSLKQKGLKRAKEFSWEKCARQVLEILT